MNALKYLQYVGINQQGDRKNFKETFFKCCHVNTIEVTSNLFSSTCCFYAITLGRRQGDTFDKLRQFINNRGFVFFRTCGGRRLGLD